MAVLRLLDEMVATHNVRRAVLEDSFVGGNLQAKLDNIIGFAFNAWKGAMEFWLNGDGREVVNALVRVIKTMLVTAAGQRDKAVEAMAFKFTDVFMEQLQKMATKRFACSYTHAYIHTYLRTRACEHTDTIKHKYRHRH